MRDLEADQPLVECFRGDGGACVLTPRCRLKKRLAAARQAFLAELDTTTLADCAYPPSRAEIASSREQEDRCMAFKMPGKDEPVRLVSYLTTPLDKGSTAAVLGAFRNPSRRLRSC